MKNQKKKDEFFSSVSEITSSYYNFKFKKYFNKNSNVLDFGCGQGNLLKLIKCTNKVGVEINKYSRKKLKLNKIKYFSDLSKIKGIKFDLIFALSVIDHVQNPAEIIKKLKNLLKKDGKIIFIIRYDHINDNQHNKYKEHFFSWSRLSFSNFLQSLNLKVLECEILKFTLPPKYYLLNEIFGKKILIFLSKIYYYFNLKDKRIYFVAKN